MSSMQVFRSVFASITPWVLGFRLRHVGCTPKRVQYGRLTVKFQKPNQGSYLILVAAVCVLALACGDADATPDEVSLNSADAIAVDGSGGFKVGHSRFAITLTSSDRKSRAIDVEVWYPAADEDWAAEAPSVYRSRLWGVSLASTMDPLRFQTVSALARENVPVKRGRPFPLVIHSHGTNGSPFDVSETMEILARHGYVVAAPWHTGNNSDDGRVDLVNMAARRNVVACVSGQPVPCSDANAGRTIADRVLDLKAVQDNIGAFLGTQANTSSVAVFGYSRGGVAAMAAAGGSVAFGITAMDSRLKGIFAWAGGRPPIMDPVDTNRIDRPAVFMTSTGDQLIPASDMKAAYDRMPTSKKAIFQLNNATHGSIRSDTCAQMQSAGAIQLTNSRAFLENDRLNTLLAGAGAIQSGTAYTYCEYPSFSTPVDITGLVASIGGILPTPTNVPSQLSTVDCVRATNRLLLSFLHVVLNPSGEANFSDGGYLNPQFALSHEPALATAEATYLPSEQDHGNRYEDHSVGGPDDDLEPFRDY